MLVSKFTLFQHNPLSVFGFWLTKVTFMRPSILLVLLAMSTISAIAQTTQTSAPSVVQPGAPGQPTKSLPANTRPKLQTVSPKDVEFMQGMIMHHAQAVAMVELMGSRTKNKELNLLGARISQSQSDEMSFMKRWLFTRGESPEMKMSGSSHSGHSGHSGGDSEIVMPGMLTAIQMAELSDSKEAEFDRLFLNGMIQHHNGALLMVNDLFNTAGAGQDAELFNFATDVDSGQRAEIRVMQSMLELAK